ncbi:MAG TPA: SMI1/KNR4 family protein, partial [Clostridium sp.]|nr:SMI1/KNR4 family protein [Clostridium sp.]
HEGGNPEEKFNNSKLEMSWSKIPESVRRFYENVHDGFYYYASQSMGLVPRQSVTYFNDDEWRIIDDLEEPIKI